MLDSLSQLFGAGLPPLVCRGDPVPCAIVLDYIGMVDRKIRRPSVEIVYGVAALTHHVLDERVGLGDCTGRIVDELRLDGRPTGLVALALLRRKRSDLELLAPLFAGAKLRLGLALRRRVGSHPVVLGTKP